MLLCSAALNQGSCAPLFRETRYRTHWRPDARNRLAILRQYLKKMEVAMPAKLAAGLSTTAIEWSASRCGETVTGLLQKINATASDVFDI